MKSVLILGTVAVLATAVFAQAPGDKQVARAADGKPAAAANAAKASAMTDAEKAELDVTAQKKAVLEAEQAWLHAIEKYDGEALPNLLRPEFLDIDEDGHTHNGSQLLQLWEKTPDAKKVATSKLKPNINAIGIRLYGEAALVTGGITYLGAKPDAAGRYPAIRFMRVWVRVNGKYGLVSAQTTRIVPDEAEKPRRSPARKSAAKGL